MSSHESDQSLYFYPQTNTELIKQLQLQPHPEGGHFAVTHVEEEEVRSPFVHPTETENDIDSVRKVQSTIYYLLSIGHNVDSHSSSIGKMHRNKSSTMHLLHVGRVRYTLISDTYPPRVRQVVMGHDLLSGEVRQLIVGGDEWKVSEVPEDDRKAATHGSNHDRVGGLISEVVTPAFDWHDHEYLTVDKFNELLSRCEKGTELYEKVRACSQYAVAP